MSKLKQIETILEVWWLQPHVGNSKVVRKGDVCCGDCFCTIDKRHTHNEWGAAKAKEIARLYES